MARSETVVAARFPVGRLEVQSLYSTRIEESYVQRSSAAPDQPARARSGLDRCLSAGACTRGAGLGGTHGRLRSVLAVPDGKSRTHLLLLRHEHVWGIRHQRDQSSILKNGKTTGWA